jgi:hypothetical protein
MKKIKVSPNDVLKRARVLLERGWTQEALARDAENIPCPYMYPEAFKFCALGAIRRSVYELTKGRLVDEVTSNARIQLQRCLPQGYTDLALYNDSLSTVAPLLAVFDKAIL